MDARTSGGRVTVGRLLIDPPAAGAWNMAVDEALLASAAEGGLVTLRFYRWRPATLSLGYFQPSAAVAGQVGLTGLDMVRRRSGGGALVHHHELTYSFTAPLNNRAAVGAGPWYDAFHETLIEALRPWTPEAQLHAGDQRGAAFLCFERRSAGDVVLRCAKIAGSAQRRGRGGFLQHGGVLLAASPHAPQLPGVTELADRAPHEQELIDRWSALLADRLNVQWRLGALSESERAAAERERRLRFASPEWTGRR